jgi:hypothetical protein
LGSSLLLSLYYATYPSDVSKIFPDGERYDTGARQPTIGTMMFVTSAIPAVQAKRIPS